MNIAHELSAINDIAAIDKNCGALGDRTTITKRPIAARLHKIGVRYVD